MVFKTLCKFAGAKRIPLIKFRKGGNLIPASGAAPGTATQASDSFKQAASKTKAAASSGTAIEDWELPARYWRKPIDKAEEEYINRGGPA